MIKKSVKNGLFKSRFLSREKKPPLSQLFRYFRYESRNTNYFSYQIYVNAIHKTYEAKTRLRSSTRPKSAKIDL